MKNLKAALKAGGLKADIRLVKVRNDAEAARLKFQGSPSFRVNGVELWPEKRSAYNLSCRIYATPQGLKGFPTEEMLRKKLRDHGLKDG